METRSLGATQIAIYHFQAALHLKAGGWVAFEGLARCYGDNLCEYEPAICWMKQAIAAVPVAEAFWNIEIHFESRIADYYLHLGKDEDALKVAQIAYKRGHYIRYGTGTTSEISLLRGIKNLFEALYKTQQYEDIVKLIYELDATPTLLENTTLLLAFTQAQYHGDLNILFFDKMGEILRITKNLGLTVLFQRILDLVDVLDSEKVTEDRNVWLVYQVALWKYHYGDQPEDSIGTWEKLVNLIDQSSELNQQSMASYRTAAATFLSMAYFDSAKDALGKREDPKPLIKKLSNLTKHK